GMAVVMLIAFWMYDELSYNKSLGNYDRTVQLLHNWDDKVNNEVITEKVMPVPLAQELRTKYPEQFAQVALVKNTGSHVFAFAEKKISYPGLFFEKEMADILALPMISGSAAGLNSPDQVLLSESSARGLFGSTDVIGKTIRIDNKTTLSVGGVYRDFQRNTKFYNTGFILGWPYLEAAQPWVKNSRDQWNNNSFQLYARLNPGIDMDRAGKQVWNALQNKPGRDDNPHVLLHPMAKWHLYDEFKNGVNTGGTIRFVWMFGIIGGFVLLLACINFMNLSTARSQKRAREVGIRKSVGSMRKQLIFQFMSESVMIAGIALVISLVFVTLALPWFNHLSDKDLHIPFSNPVFWVTLIAFTLITGLVAGSYPALYLSSFNPVTVLKGTFRVGKLATLPRKVLVVIQFTVSVSLIIGTIVIFQQIEHARNRPIGFDRNGLLTVFMTTPDLFGKYDVLRRDLINSGAAVNMAEASNPSTDVSMHLIGFEWPGKNQAGEIDFGVSFVTYDFGKTVGWNFLKGRDFSREFKTDSSGMILNEAAARFMGLKKGVGETVKFDDKPYRVIGIIQNPVMESPYAKPVPTVFMMNYENVYVITVKVNPAMSMSSALPKIEAIFRKYNPSAPFEYHFAEDDFMAKFAAEQRIGSLATFFAVFAIIISCLGIFGLASFMAEQRIKEIGVRKVLGASVFNLWRLLSMDFVALVGVSFLLAFPLSWYFMENWLQSYAYRTSVSPWIFLVAMAGTLLITVATVSFQAVRAALMNPVKSLRSE
ncbi:MAG: ABC transporter permease, partial [Mucilaginibacter polytrichastri]|nr:ABC transporter permease [Mucilaginibacter polytrichastri]